MDNKKPIGTPAPNYPKPKAEPAPAPKQQLAPKSESAKLGKVKVQPGSPFKSESVPVGVQQGKHENPKRVEKRINKMFKDTNQPTLGIWNKDNTNPMSKPDKIRFNPNLNYKPSKEALEAANRKKIMNAGFAPNKGPDYYAKSPKGFGDTSKRLKDWGDKNKIFVDEKSTKNYYDEEPDFWNVTGKKGGLYVFPNENGRYSVRSDVVNQIADVENEDELFKYLEDWNATDTEEHSQQSSDSNQQTSNFLKVNGEWIDVNGNNDYGFRHYVKDGMVHQFSEETGNDYVIGKLEDQSDSNPNLDKDQERSKASELYGTDLNKQQGYDYDRLSQELDKGDFVNLDAGLLPYEYGFNTNGHEDLAVDARKNPETGKYEVFMYPETENGPVSDYEPDENYPDYEFDSFDDLKAFMENNYKKVEKPEWDPADEPGSGVVSKKLTDFVREYLTKQVGKEFADITANKLSQNSNMADGYKRIMKKELGGGNQ